MSVQRLILPGELACDYAVREVESPKRTILLLHGYTLSGPWLLRHLGKSLPADARVLAPSAPYPLPEKVDGKYRVGYSWYFYDPTRDEYFIDMRVAVSYLESFLKAMDAESLPLTIVGYSQGGYLAPFVAEKIGDRIPIERIIGIACQFLEDEFHPPIRSRGEIVRMDAIHGEDDDTVSCGAARASHEAILRAGGAGEFVGVPGVGHRIGPEIQKALSSRF